MRFDGFKDETLVPRDRVRLDAAQVTISDCVGSTSSLQKRAGEPVQTIPAEWERKVREFATSNSTKQLSLPSSLTSFQRRLVHKLCEELGLSSHSKGRDDRRHLVVERENTYWRAHQQLESEVTGVVQIHRRRRAEAYVILDDGGSDMFLAGDQCHLWMLTDELLHQMSPVGTVRWKATMSLWTHQRTL